MCSDQCVATATERIVNFSAGPAAMPESVLRQAQRDLWDLNGTGIGVCEHSHRGKAFAAVAQKAEADCRSLAGISDDYDVLFLQGGASLQFAMVPMNFLSQDRTADYLVTGSWSKKAVKEAEPFGTVHIAGSSAATNFDRIPAGHEITFSSGAAYVHFTSNNTIFGTQWASEPRAPRGSALICDASSDIFCRPIDISKYGLIYAGAQKNLGPSGVVLVIIRKDLVARGNPDLPTMLQYRTHSENQSMFNTPNTFGIYVMGRTFEWILEQGGLSAMQRHNESKARLIYDYLDSSDFFRGTAQVDSRSIMNVCFRGPSEDLEAKFLTEAQSAGLSGLKGHRSVGGMRASIYNAMTMEGCERLVEFMKRFESENRTG